MFLPVENRGYSIKKNVHDMGFLQKIIGDA